MTRVTSKGKHHLYKNLWGTSMHKIKALLHRLHPNFNNSVTIGLKSKRLNHLRGQLKIVLDKTPSNTMTLQEAQIIDHIQKKVLLHNRNNVTRTEAYWKLYQEHPELHWALLAHMVSRNGGWNMTDLKGELLTRLLSSKQLCQIFEFLERSNALIFQDAYPQLLLYKESRNLGKPLFHLLPHFHVSSFMMPCWDDFWDTRDPVLLTIALIINEQHYIEDRVVKHPEFKHNVLHTLFFHAQSLLQLNQVILPFVSNSSQTTPISHHPNKTGIKRQLLSTAEVKMTGAIMENFSSVKERIHVGKTLYTQLFHSRFSGNIQQFASLVKHTGSRSDYWPRLFTSANLSNPKASYTERLKGCKIMPAAEPIHSPNLEAAWPDYPLQAPERFDWFNDLAVTDFFKQTSIPKPMDMTEEYCFGLNKLELAVRAGEKLSID